MNIQGKRMSVQKCDLVLFAHNQAVKLLYIALPLSLFYMIFHDVMH